MKGLKLLAIMLALTLITILTGCFNVKESAPNTSNTTLVESKNNTTTVESKESFSSNVTYSISNTTTTTVTDATLEEGLPVIVTYSADTSDNIQSEKQAIEDMNSRGFVEYPVSYEYSTNGEYIGKQEATDVDEKHPIYQTYYYSPNNELWTIIATNGNMMANPVSYNIQSEQDIHIVFIETETITAYDSNNNSFYEITPNGSTLSAYIVDKINAETLASFTVEAINTMK